MPYEVRIGPYHMEGPWPALGQLQPPWMSPPASQARKKPSELINRFGSLDRRLAMFGEKVSDLLNSLLRNGYLVRSGSSPVSYLPLCGALTADRPPTAADDFAAGAVQGCLWIDEHAPQAYICLDSTIGLAVWQSVTGNAIPPFVSGGYTGRT